MRNQESRIKNQAFGLGGDNLQKLNKYIRRLPWIILLAWMAVIFSFSAQPTQVSNGMSISIASSAVLAGEQIGVLKSGSIKQPGFIQQVNYIFRKYVHGAIYMILSMLMISVLRKWDRSFWRAMILSLLICLLFAAGDELHQRFVPGRNGRLEDILIDSIGAMTGLGLYWIRNRKGLYREKPPIPSADFLPRK